MKLKTPEADDKSEIAGRFYQATDLKMAIDAGHLKTIDDVLAWAKTNAVELDALMQLPVWVIADNACIDFKASIEHGRGLEIAPEPESVVFAERVDHVNCPFCRVEQHPNAAHPKGGNYRCEECESVFRVAPKSSNAINLDRLLKLEKSLIHEARTYLIEIQSALASGSISDEKAKENIKTGYAATKTLTALANISDSGLSDETCRELHAVEDELEKSEKGYIEAHQATKH